jgi:hypothetical protein
LHLLWGLRTHQGDDQPYRGGDGGVLLLDDSVQPYARHPHQTQSPAKLQDVLHSASSIQASCQLFSFSSSSSPPNTLLVYLYQVSVNQLDHLNPVSLRLVPSPLHLDGEELTQVCTEESTSPLHPTFTSRPWRRCKGPVFQEPEFVQTEKGKKKASLLSQAWKQLSQDDLTCTLPFWLRTLLIYQGLRR